MTKKQAREDAAGQLTRTAVIDAALQVLDERGLDGLSTRAVADRLGVRMNTVLWHVKTKARMLELMADAVLADIGYDDLPDAPLERARELTGRYRRTLLAHRDGAALVTGTYSAEPHTLRFADRLVDAFLEAGADERQAAWTTWTVNYFTLGLTQEEQAAPKKATNVSTRPSTPPHTRPCNESCPTSDRTSTSASPSAWRRSCPASRHDGVPS